MKIILSIFVALLFAFVCFSQTKRQPKRLVISNLANVNVCGTSEKPPSEILIGTIVKREFENDELRLNGIVIKDKTDQRIFINIDAEHISNIGSSASQRISLLLTNGKQIKFWVYRCRRIFYVYKVEI